MTCQSSCCKLVCWSYQEIESDAVLILCTYAHHFLYKLPDYGTTITQHGLAACTKNPDFGDYTGHQLGELGFLLPHGNIDFL